MLYQKLFEPDTPYIATIIELTKDSDIPLHFHYEFEIAYCIAGEFDVLYNGELKKVLPGDIILIGSMVAHTFKIKKNVKMLTIELGPLFLKESFKILSEINFENFVLNDPSITVYNELYRYIQEIISQSIKSSHSSNLMIIGDLYKICAVLLDSYAGMDRRKKDKYSLAIEKAMELIYYNFAENITVEDAAKSVGYGTANFCKIFKKATGMGFHEYLNSYRIKTACHILLQTDLNVEKVGEMVGFNETKSFCRVFKKEVGITPGQYRKEN